VHYYSSLLVGITEDGKSFWFWLVAPIQKLIAPQSEKAHQDYLIKLSHHNEGERGKEEHFRIIA
jgi:hypothetical protein